LCAVLMPAAVIPPIKVECLRRDTSALSAVKTCVRRMGTVFLLIKDTRGGLKCHLTHRERERERDRELQREREGGQTGRSQGSHRHTTSKSTPSGNHWVIQVAYVHTKVVPI